MKKKILISPSLFYHKERKTFYDQIDVRLIRFFLDLGYLPIVVSHINKKPVKYFENLTIHAIVLSGGSNIGEYPLRDDFEKKLISLSIKKKIPLLGICRGMQMINHFYKGRLVKIKNHVRKKHIIKNISNKYSISVNSYHNFAIDQKYLSKELKTIFICKRDKSHEAFIHKSQKILGIMWHPEREKKFRVFDKKLIKIFLTKIKTFRKKYE